MGATGQRKEKSKGESVWIPEELVDLVLALKDKDMKKAVAQYARWVINLNKQSVRVPDKSVIKTQVKG